MRSLIDYFGDFKANIFFSFTAMVVTIVVLEMILGSTLVTGQTIILAMAISMIQSVLQIVIFKNNNIKYSNRISLFLLVLLIVFVAISVLYKWLNVNSTYNWLLFTSLFMACSIASTLGMAYYERLKFGRSS